MNRFHFQLLLLLAAVSLCYNSAVAQEDATSPKPKKQRGTIYALWGYNREAYTKSTIHFKNTTTDNYDFTLHNASAHDKNMGDMRDFFHKGATIPQYNCAIGYLFNDKHNWGIEVSWDHLKYIVDDNQVMRVSGQIRGRQIDKDTLVDPNFVHLQHTNGNNYLMLNVVKKTSLYKRPMFELSINTKFGAGPLVSYSISTVLGSTDGGRFRVHGYVVGLSTGLRADIFKYFFLQLNAQGAFANYLSTELGEDRQGRAKHHFFSIAGMASFGVNVPLEDFVKKL